MEYAVTIHHVTMDEFSTVLLARAAAHAYEQIGWTGVRVVKRSGYSDNNSDSNAPETDFGNISK